MPMEQHGQRIGLFGGSFDPPHNAHLAIAGAAVSLCHLDKLLFIPCRESPLKGRTPGAPADDRLAMLRLATSALPWAEVCDWELHRPGPSYSWQTVEHIARTHPGERLYWLMGEDQWKVIERWANPDFLRQHLTFIVFARNGAVPALREGWQHVFLPGEFPGSSTEARTKLAAGNRADDLLPEAVETYAISRRLYTTGDH